ncbi:MAG: hypothetical protein HON47_01345 [Candidatus Diapherotrites archaeon]|jgi:hypothetical protein|uniref:Uncharacterized protein n=1 Tax=Candidatus Iainarchaeum sp. TaxID=3101447 RepID=A0A8T5GEE6_9ARCH|nr:hypothetical protein [Candidatus Diapherotrites archaeon]MBT7241434.1 hypothetical protein [Candidatus Diapherotrites archaeon]
MFGNKKILATIVVIAILAFATGAGAISAFMMQDEMNMSVEEKREDFITLKESIQEDMRHDHKFRCCLMKPCTYCIEKTPGHGEGAECDCLSDLMNGVHPCGECIGEIMEGHGNSLLANTFAVAIAEKMGDQHLPALKQMMFEKYGVLVEDQE